MSDLEARQAELLEEARECQAEGFDDITERVNAAAILAVFAERDEAQAVARVAFWHWASHQESGCDPGCGPDQEIIEAMVSASPWLAVRNAPEILTSPLAREQMAKSDG